MKTLVFAALALTALATVGPAEAILKCPQADGSVVSVPESVGCSTEFERAQQRAEQAAASQRRQAERAAELQRLQTERAAQQGADFVRASAACTEQANRHKLYDDPAFKTVAKSDGTVRMLGTAKDRFDYDTCMEQRGHSLERK